MSIISVYCKNVEKTFECNPGTTLKELMAQVNPPTKFPVLCALVDNQLKELSFEIYMPHTIEFLDYTHPDGFRTYSRSLSFIMQRAVAELYPQYSLAIEYNLQNGLYVEMHTIDNSGEVAVETISLSEDEIDAIRDRMQELILADIPFLRERLHTEDAITLFKANHRAEKALLHQGRGRFFTTVCFMDGYADYFYGPLVYSTGLITSWSIESFSRGLLLDIPQMTSPYEIRKMPYQYKLFDVFKEYANWCYVLGARGVGSLNRLMLSGGTVEMIQISEALHEKKYAAIADEINMRRSSVKIVLIAGPSSSGKTTSSKRIALQARVLGLNPVLLEMDNYFVNREDTPLDEFGNYDFDSLGALDTAFLNEQINDLLAGHTIRVPKFNFNTGKRMFNGTELTLKENDILIMEGIHGLNPELTKHIPADKIYRIYASALTSLSLDENNNISTSDNRLLRRIVRDSLFRGVSPEETIERWASVRRGEIHNIFPYQENADIMFNSALIYELPLLRYYAEPALRRITPNSPAYAESMRLLNFLSYIHEMDREEIALVPPTSVLREFIGGSSFTY